MVNVIGIVIKQQYNITKKHTEDKTMIKANELRIGNLIILPNGDIGKISYHEIRLMVVAIEKPDYQPIPLTEEWLLKFGFQWKNFAFRDGTFTVRFQKEFYVYLSLEGVRPIQIKLEHCHQLQNLYFALTGEELTIKQ